MKNEEEFETLEETSSTENKMSITDLMSSDVPVAKNQPQNFNPFNEAILNPTQPEGATNVVENNTQNQNTNPNQNKTNLVLACSILAIIVVGIGIYFILPKEKEMESSPTTTKESVSKKTTVKTTTQTASIKNEVDNIFDFDEEDFKNVNYNFLKTISPTSKDNFIIDDGFDSIGIIGNGIYSGSSEESFSSESYVYINQNGAYKLVFGDITEYKAPSVSKDLITEKKNAITNLSNDYIGISKIKSEDDIVSLFYKGIKSYKGEEVYMIYYSYLNEGDSSYADSKVILVSTKTNTISYVIDLGTMLVDLDEPDKVFDKFNSSLKNIDTNKEIEFVVMYPYNGVEKIYHYIQSNGAYATELTRANETEQVSESYIDELIDYLFDI